MSVTTTRMTARKKKVLALLSGGLVLGVGAMVTLASWTDSEWVFGGQNGDPNIGASVFEVEQNTVAPFTIPANWVQFENNPGGELVFSPGSLALTPGDSVYAPVALRTTANSVAGRVVLQPAIAATDITVDDVGGLLWAALAQRVVTSTSVFTCDANAFTTLAPFATGALGTAAGASPGQSLALASGSTQYYCFEITLPSGSPDTLQGRTVAPAWEFVAVSS